MNTISAQMMGHMFRHLDDAIRYLEMTPPDVDLAKHRIGFVRADLMRAAVSDVAVETVP
jgi:hypothetical protein